MFPTALRAETTVTFPSVPGSGITVRLATPLTQLPHFGFLPVRVFVENLSAHDGSWDLTFQVGHRGSASAILDSTHTITAPAGQTRESWLYVPVAQAGFIINAASGGGGGPGVGVTATTPRVTITKTPTGTKVSRVFGSGGVTTVFDINESTGEMSTLTTGTLGQVLSTNTSRPPSGQDVTYTIDPASGYVSTRYKPSAIAGSPKVTVIRTPSSGSGTASGRAMRNAPKVTITPTANGLKVKRVTTLGRRELTEETEFDTSTATITVTRTMPDGTVTTTPRPPFNPGSEVTVTIDPTTGTHNVNVRSTGNTSALPKMTVTVSGTGTTVGAAVATGAATAPGSGGGAATAPAGSTVATPITVEISGAGFVGGARVVIPNNSGGNTMRPFAVAAALEAGFRGVISPEVRGAPNLSAVTLGQLPADWRVWSSFAGVVLAADEFAGLDAARRGALRGWVGMGGQLYLVPTTAGETTSENIGAGRIVTLPAPLAEIGGGSLRETLKIYAETPALPDRETLFLKNTALGGEISADGKDSSWVAVFLVVFAAVIGPVNLFVFAPRAKRHRLFWTTPALALVGGLVLVAAIFLQDGIGGSGRRSTLVILLPGQNQAAVFQEQAARTGFLIGSRFPLDDDVMLAPLAIEAEGNAYWANAATVLRAGGQASGEWFQSRSRPAHLLRRLAPTRGRVELVGTAAGGAPIVESSVATVLTGFVLEDRMGKHWTAREISPGRRVMLEAMINENRFGSSFENTPFSLGASAGMANAIAAATTPRAGRWTAYGGETEVAPIATLPSLRWGKTSVLYVGEAEQPAVSPQKNGGAL